VHVAHERIEPSRYPRIAHGLLYLYYATKFETRLPSGLGLAQAALNQVVDAAVHVIPQFSIEVKFQLIALPPEEIKEPGHGLCFLFEDQLDG
jgi:hypothetical protein